MTWKDEKILDVLYDLESNYALAINEYHQLILLDKENNELLRFSVGYENLYEFGKTLWRNFKPSMGLVGM